MQNNPNGFAFDPDTYYVVDYNAALNFPEFFDPDADLPERHLIIPRGYQKSLHKMQDEESDRGIASNELANHLYELIEKGKKTRNDGAVEYHLQNLHVIFDYQDHPYNGKKLEGEHIKETITLAEYWSEQQSIKRVVILTNNPLMQISAIDRPNLQIHMFSPAPYTGYRRTWNKEAIDFWRRSKCMSLDKWQECHPDAEPLHPHEFVLFGKTNAFGHIGRYNASRKMIVPLTYYRQLHGVTPIGELQAMAFEVLMAPADEISVVILYGNAGAGKTFAAVSTALAQSGMANAKFTDVPGPDTNDKNNRGNGRKRRKAQSSYGSGGIVESIMNQPSDEDYPYQSIILCPPDRMLGDKMAPVPGDKRAKLVDKLDAYLDNIRNYLRSRGDKKTGGFPLSERDIATRATSILNNIELCTPGQINGRSFWDTFFICDEAQFNTLSQIKAYIERCDSGTKLALCGDPSQTKNPFGWHGNPLARAVRYLGKDDNVAIVYFDGESEIKRPGAQIIARSWPR